MTSFTIKKEKTPHTLPSGGDVCRAIFAHFFHFLFFLVGTIKKVTVNTNVWRSTFERSYRFPKEAEVPRGVDTKEYHKHVSQNQIEH